MQAEAAEPWVIELWWTFEWMQDGWRSDMFFRLLVGICGMGVGKEWFMSVGVASSRKARRLKERKNGVIVFYAKKRSKRGVGGLFRVWLGLTPHFVHVVHAVSVYCLFEPCSRTSFSFWLVIIRPCRALEVTLSKL